MNFRARRTNGNRRSTSRFSSMPGIVMQMAAEENNAMHGSARVNGFDCRPFLLKDSHMKTALLSRRHFLRTSAVGGIGLTLAAKYASVFLSAADASGKKIPIGLEMYSVRNECQRDFPRTVRAV